MKSLRRICFIQTVILAGALPPVLRILASAFADLPCEVMFDGLNPQNFQEFVGRDGRTYRAVRVVSSPCRDGALIEKALYQSTDGNSLWVLRMDSATRRYVWEVPGEAEPRIDAERGTDVSKGLRKHFYWTADFEEGFIMASVQTRGLDSSKSIYLNAGAEYQRTVEYFGQHQVKGIKAFWPGDWELSDNLAAFNRWTAPPYSLRPEEAVWKTHEGEQASKLGFKKAEIESWTPRKNAGNYRDVRVTFTRP